MNNIQDLIEHTTWKKIQLNLFDWRDLSTLCNYISLHNLVDKKITNEVVGQFFNQVVYISEIKDILDGTIYKKFFNNEIDDNLIDKIWNQLTE